ncbi:MAG TPA: hypothetical protein VM737_01690 [Gemmatimonadota bacterium]|nr:hypothetical protein [Gemmatimonadota bacterium]
MSGRRARRLRLLALSFAAAPFAVPSLAARPAVAQQAERGVGPFEAAREAYQPAADDPGVLAAMARAASETGDLPRFRAVLDSVVGAGTAGPHAVAYWGALSLQADAAPDSVAAAFDRHLARAANDRAALLAFFRVLEAHGAYAAAEVLLDRAEGRGVRPTTLAGMRGEVRERRGDPAGALEAYLAAIADGETVAVTAAARIEGLLARWPETAAAAERLETARDALPEDVRRLVVPLLVRAWIGTGDWAAARHAAQDPALDRETTGELLRRVAAGARGAGEPAAAEVTLEDLLSLGPPAARPSDRLLLAEVTRERGDPDEAVAELRRAAAAGVAGAGRRVLIAEVEAAREAGDAARLAGSIERARAGGVDPAQIGVPAGDLALAAGAPDSALAAYARAAGDPSIGPAALEALARVRVVQWLLRVRVPSATYAALGATLVAAPAGPALAAARLDSLAAAIGAEPAHSLLMGLAAEWHGRAGDPAGASVALALAASRPEAGAESPGLLLAAGRWARAAGNELRAAELWEGLLRDHAGSPYALEARRLLRHPPPPEGKETGEDGHDSGQRGK